MSDYKENGVDITTKFEFYPASEGVIVTDSLFTDGTGTFKQGGIDLKTTLSGTIPSSAGTGYLGGNNTSISYKHSGTPINAALHGCRPMGKWSYTINASVGADATYYINRVNGQTWLSTSQSSATGTRLAHDPLFVHLELQGGGASGACRYSGLYYRKGGGSAGAYIYYPAAIPENGCLKIVVGHGGTVKSIDRSETGNPGGDTILYSNSTELCRAHGGYAGGDMNHTWNGKVPSADRDKTCGMEGGDATINGVSTNRNTVAITVTTPQGCQAWGRKGGYSGGAEERDTSNDGENLPQVNVQFSVPEGRYETHGPISGIGAKNNLAGGGGSSYFARGGNRAEDEGNPGSLGSGGSSGGGLTGSNRKAGAGGAGLAIIWY